MLCQKWGDPFVGVLCRREFRLSLIEGGLGGLDLSFLGGDLQSRVLKSPLGHGKIGGRGLHGELIRGGVDLIQQIPPANQLVILDREFLDRTGDPRGDAYHVSHEHPVVATRILGVPSIGDHCGTDRQDDKAPTNHGPQDALTGMAFRWVFSKSSGILLLFGSHFIHWVKKIR